jgi:hypothetical protein
MRDETVDRALSAMQNALRHIAQSRDCDYYDYPKERPQPCDCPVCVAKMALNTEDTWRYIGARSSRLEHNPRERKIVSAWAKYMTDSKLMAIFEESARPSMRDWFVATTIVQWLATNVGMAVLEEAGFKYTKYDEDRKEREVKGYL